MTDQETPDRKIADLAGASYGVVDRAALLGADLTEHEINGRIQRGVLRAVHRCVYAVGHTALSREGRWVAAVLACGEGALLSHWSAAALWELVEEDPGWPHVTTGRRLRTSGVLQFRRRFSVPALRER